jgi:hypothetical protein
MADRSTTGWWSFAERAARSLTTPSDIQHSDAIVEDMLAGSIVVNAGRRVQEQFQRAWPASASARVWRSTAGELEPYADVDRLRLAGLATTVAALTALALRSLEPMWTGRLDAIVPAIAAVGGIAVWLAAEPLARALADRRS